MDPADDDTPLPDHRNYLVFCDESGVGGQRFYGFGSLWMPWERRGDFSGLIADLRERHGNASEIKWNSVKRRSQVFYEDIVAEFFRRNWLMFHCLVVRRGYVDRKHHKDMDEALRKHFAMLIKAKVKHFSGGDPKKAYHVRVDPLPSRYQKADEAAHKIINHTLKKELGLPAVKSLLTRDSKETPGIQVADFFLGAVMAAWQQEVTAGPKLAVMQSVAEHLGWRDLRSDTHLKEWKFNIWCFYDPTTGAPREAKTRPVRLKVRMPPFRPRR